MRKNIKRAMIGIIATGLASASVIAFAGCGIFGGNEPTVQEIETTIPNDTTILEKLANEEALVDTKVEDDKITEYFTDGSFVEYTKTSNAAANETFTDVESTNEDTGKVIIHTPNEKVIRDKEGLVKVADVKINTDSQNLIFKDNKIVVQEKVQTSEQTEADSTEESVEASEQNNTEQSSEQSVANPTPVEEKIMDVIKVKEEDIEYTVTEYEKTTYDKAFEERETFIEAAKDTDEKIEEVINKEVTEVVQEIKRQEEEAKKQAQEEAKAQDVKETEVKKDDEGNTVIIGKDNEGNKVEIVTDKQGNTEVKKTDNTGTTVAVAPIVQPKPTETVKPKTQPKPTVKPTETVKPTQPKATQHQHTWKTIHHDAVTHQETYTEKQPYTYTEKEPYTYTEKEAYTYQEPYTYTSYVDDYELYCCSKNSAGGYTYGQSIGIYKTKSEVVAAWDAHDYGDDLCYRTHQSPVQKTDYETKTGYKDVQKTGYKDVQKTGYKDVKKTRTVTDKAAWDEVVCSTCGAHK